MRVKWDTVDSRCWVSAGLNWFKVRDPDFYLETQNWPWLLTTVWIGIVHVANVLQFGEKRVSFVGSCDVHIRLQCMMLCELLMSLSCCWNTQATGTLVCAGNFQDRERMRVEKAIRIRYGRFFYRFPNGESAADVYDRITGKSLSYRLLVCRQSMLSLEDDLQHICNVESCLDNLLWDLKIAFTW